MSVSGRAKQQEKINVMYILIKIFHNSFLVNGYLFAGYIVYLITQAGHLPTSIFGISLQNERNYKEEQQINFGDEEILISKKMSICVMVNNQIRDSLLFLQPCA